MDDTRFFVCDSPDIVGYSDNDWMFAQTKDDKGAARAQQRATPKIQKDTKQAQAPDAKVPEQREPVIAGGTPQRARKSPERSRSPVPGQDKMPGSGADGVTACCTIYGGDPGDVLWDTLSTGGDTPLFGGGVSSTGGMSLRSRSGGGIKSH